MRVQYKIGFLFLTTICFVAGVSLMQSRSQQRALLRIFQKDAIEKERLFDRLLKLRSQALQLYVDETTYWDELVLAVKNKDEGWFNASVAASVAQGKADAVWIFDPAGQSVFSSFAAQGNIPRDLPIPSKEFPRFFEGRAFYQCYLAAGETVIEIVAARIHEGTDSARQRQSYGYLFAGKVWDQHVIASLSELTGSALRLADVYEEETVVGRVSSREGVITFRRALAGWDGTPLKQLVVWIESESVLEASRAIRDQTMIFLVTIAVITFSVLFFTVRWIGMPLRSLSSALSTQEIKPAQALLRRQDEFGVFAQLLNTSLTQKQELVQEIMKRSVVEGTLRSFQQRLERVNRCFLSLQADPDRNFQELTALAGEIFGAAFSFYCRLQNGKLCPVARWNVPKKFFVAPEHDCLLCRTVLGVNGSAEGMLLVEDLAASQWRSQDTAIERFGLRGYMGVRVKAGGVSRGVLTVLFQEGLSFSPDDRKLLGIVAVALGNEEERLKSNTEIKDALRASENQRRAILNILEDMDAAQKELLRLNEELKHTQAQLVQSSKMAAVGQLASGVAHEINNPLTGVLNNVQLIKMESAARPDFSVADFQELLDVVEESAMRCKKITQSLLDFSHTPKGKFAPLSLNHICEQVLILLEHELRLQNIVLERSFAAQLPPISGDGQLLQQVIFNLIGNAKWAVQKKADAAQKKIRLGTEYDEAAHTVSVVVADTGIGIPREDQDRIFDPFFTTKPVGEGTGLGLSLVYSIISVHKGRILLESEPGEGATFRIVFPSLR